MLARTLEAAHALRGVDATMIVLQQDDGGPLIATQGMSRDEALNQPIAPPSEGRAPRAVSLNYRYSDSDSGRDGNLIRGGLMVPLVGTRADVSARSPSSGAGASARPPVTRSASWRSSPRAQAR